MFHNNALTVIVKVKCIVSKVRQKLKDEVAL